MDFRFDYTREDKWPPLGWIAECAESDSVIRVRHGPQVEVRRSWFCEAVWDGEFLLGDFDKTDLVFGSGARVRDGRVVFVSSGTTVDRLQFLQLGGRTWVSNSLVCLLATTGAELDITYDRFPELFWSIVEGIDCFERRLPTRSGRLELVYFRNLTWDGHHLADDGKPSPKRDFSSFEKYHGFLKASLGKISENMCSGARTHRYEMVGALSSGYDSTTAAVLAREAGMKRVFSFRTARGGEEDDGREVARILGLDLTLVDRTGWKQQAFAEVPYFAATGLGPDVIFSSAQEILRGRVLVTGFHGDKVWAKDTKALGPNIVRGDASGLSFCEHRLLLGCLHFPVAFMGVRQIGEINALSNSSELARWDLPGDYSRPICRRIVEESGVPRGLFGVRKKAATNLFHQGEALLTEKTRTAYHRWLLENLKQWEETGRKEPKVPGPVLLVLRKRYYLIARIVNLLGSLLTKKLRSWAADKNTRMERQLNRRINLIAHLFPWAVEQLIGVYRSKRM